MGYCTFFVTNLTRKCYSSMFNFVWLWFPVMLNILTILLDIYVSPFCQFYITIFCLIGRNKWFCYGFQGALIHCISSLLGLLQIVFVVCLLTLTVAIFDIHRLNFYIYSNLELFSLWLLFWNPNNNNNYRLISHHNIIHFHFV